MNNRMIIETLNPNGKFIMLKIMVETYGPSLALYMSALASSDSDEYICGDDEIISYNKEDELDIFCMESAYVDLVIGQGQRYGVINVHEGPDPKKRYISIDGPRFERLMEEALDRRLARTQAKARAEREASKARAKAARSCKRVKL